MLAGSLGVAALSFVAGAEAYAAPPKKPNPPGATKTADDLITFTNLAKDNGPLPKVAAEYEYQVLIPWREKLDGSGTSFDYNGFTAAQQEQAIGIGHDGMWLFTEGNDAGVLVVNHEYGENEHIYGAAQPVSLEQVRLSQAAHGVAVVKIAKQGGTWKVQADRRNRRITANTSVEFSGPAAKSAKLVTKIGANDPKGTLNNCAMGHTPPWGHLPHLRGELPQLRGCHRRLDPDRGAQALRHQRGRRRLRLVQVRRSLRHREEPERGEPFRLGRRDRPERSEQEAGQAHRAGSLQARGACVTVGRGGQRVVVYSGDDERNEYIYKFVSAKNYKSMQAQGQSPLDEGVLYVAAFKADGTGEWLELSPEEPEAGRVDPGGHPDQHPDRRRPGRRHHDGPAGVDHRRPGRRDVRHPDQQHLAQGAGSPGQPVREQPERSHRQVARRRRPHRHHLRVGLLRHRQRCQG